MTNRSITNSLHPPHADSQENIDTGFDGSALCCFAGYHGNDAAKLLPFSRKPYFRADVFYPDGYSINDVVKEMKSVEEHLAKQPEVKKVSITFGSTPLRYYLASTSVGPKPNFANVWLN